MDGHCCVREVMLGSPLYVVREYIVSYQSFYYCGVIHCWMVCNCILMGILNCEINYILPGSKVSGENIGFVRLEIRIVISSSSQSLYVGWLYD